MLLFLLAHVLAEKINVNLSYMDSPLVDIVWCGESNVIVLSSRGSVYRSSDDGQQWTKQAELFQKKGLVVLKEESESVGVVYKIQRSPVNQQLILFIGSEYVNWISGDCGKTISAIYTGRQMREFQVMNILYQLHPKNENWILASSWSRCDKQANCATTKDLMLTTDAGANWKVIARYVNQFAWAKSEVQERIIISYDPQGTGHQQVSGWNMKSHLYYSDDFLVSKTMMVSQGNKFQQTNTHIYVAQVMSTQAQQVTLLVSENDKYQFRYAELPEMQREHSYTIVDSSHGAFININHIRPNSVIGTTYASDSTGTRFSLSLNNTVRTEEGQCDFERALGLEGIYIANVYGEEAILDDAQLSKFKQTRITFDKGAHWQAIKQPAKDSSGQVISCSQCSLHLHQVSTKLQFGPFYSTKNSIGILLATGNVGKYLSYRPDQVNTYMSHDGGAHWQEVSKGSHIYDIGDHGGLIVLANDQTATKTLKYSSNEGLTWETFKFSDVEVEISNIITEPSNTARKFMIYGTALMNEQEQGVIITLDFSKLHDRQCVGAEDASQDYELWAPLQKECLMGRKVEYVRRKRDAQCFNGEDLERQHSVEVCECTEADWQCDLNYYRDPNSGKCVAYELYEPSTEPPKVCRGIYQITRGYRRVPGNQCQGGIQYDPLELACPGAYGIWDLILVILFGGIVYILYRNRHLIIKKEVPQPSGRAYAQKMQSQLGYSEFDSDLLEESV